MTIFGEKQRLHADFKKVESFFSQMNLRECSLLLCLSLGKL
jgi:hypothetical protein